MEYNAENKPTVWAICPEVQAFLHLTKNQQDGHVRKTIVDREEQ